MPNKKIPWWQPEIGQHELKLVTDVLNSNYINEGEVAREFEKKIAKLVGTQYAVVTTSCTTAIFLALKALGIGHNDEVIVPDMTFIATANAAEMTGAKPVLVDIEPADLTISLANIEKAITPQTKAIVPVHVTGRACDMEGVLRLAKKYNLHVIEDAAEAFMSKHQGYYLGTFGEAGCFSFSPNKTISTGQGGIIVTNNSELVTKLHMLKDQGRPFRGSGGNDKHDVIGYNFKMTNLQAAIGIGQLNYLEARIKRMRKIYELYNSELKNIKGLTLYPCDLDGGAVPQWTDITTTHRDALVEHLLNYGIDSRKYWIPIHRQLAYKLPDDNFSESLRLSPISLWLPSAFTLTDEDVLFICEKIKEFFKNN